MSLLRIELDHAYVHGDVAPPLFLDGDVHRLVASLVAGEKGVSLDVLQTGLIERKLLSAPVSGSGQYHLQVAEGVRMWAEFAGEVGAVEVIASADMDGKRVHAIADVPHASPSDIETIVSHVPLDGAISAHTEIEGELPDLDVTGHVGSRDGAAGTPEIAIEGTLSVASPVRLTADVRARDLDPSRFAALAPSFTISADARVAVELGQSLRVSVDARTQPTTLSGQVIPGTLASLVLDRGVLFGRASIDEEGAPIDGAFTFSPSEGLRFDARGDVASFRATPRIKGPVDGSAHVHVTGLLRGAELDADVTASGSGLELEGGAALDRVNVNGKITGSLADLSIDAGIQGSGMHAGGYDFEHVKGHATGPVRALRVGAVLDSTIGTTIKADGLLDTGARGVRGITVDVQKDGTELRGTIGYITAGPSGGVTIDGAKLKGEGVGAIESTLVVEGRDVTGKFKGDGVNLERIAALAGVPYRVRGIADIDVEIARGPHGRSGHILLALENGEGPLLSGVSASIATRFHDDELDADALVRIVAKATKPEPEEDRCDGTIAEVRIEGGERIAPRPAPRSQDVGTRHRRRARRGRRLEPPLHRPSRPRGLTHQRDPRIADDAVRCFAPRGATFRFYQERVSPHQQARGRGPGGERERQACVGVAIHQRAAPRGTRRRERTHERGAHALRRQPPRRRVDGRRSRSEDARRQPRAPRGISSGRRSSAPSSPSPSGASRA